jgi:ABC-type Fe3+ transport system permease subunit
VRADPNQKATRFELLAWSVLLLLCLAPVLAASSILVASPVKAYGLGMELVGSLRLWGLWGKTCAIALGSAAVSAMLGGMLGVCLDGASRKFRRWMLPLLIVPALLPTHVLAVAWIDVLGQRGLLADFGIPVFSVYSSPGVVLVHSLSWYPLSMVAVGHRLQNLDPSIREAASTVSSWGPIFWRITLPLLWPALAAATLVVFVLSLLSFSVPSLLQVPVYTVEIYTSFNSLLDGRQAVLLALPLATTGILAALALFRISATQPGNVPGHSPATERVRKSSLWHLGIPVVVSLVTLGLPCVALLRRVGSFAALGYAFQTGAHEIGTSLLLGSLGATALLVLVLPLARKRTSGVRSPLWPAALAYLISGPVFGVGLIQLWNHSGPAGYLYDHFWILLVAVAGRYALFAWIGCRVVLQWLPRHCVDVARNLGAGPWYRLFTVELSFLRRPLLAVWSCLFLLIMGELESIVLVAPPGWVPISLRIFTLMHYGPSALVSALAFLQALAAGATLLVFAFLLDSGKVYRSYKS